MASIPPATHAAPNPSAVAPHASASASNGRPKPYRGRLAPSPTGYLHMGHARTFWTAYERAVEAGGCIVMRNEDLDKDRTKPEVGRMALGRQM